MLIDTHAHLYTGEFDTDRNEMIERTIQSGIKKMILPNIDESSIEGMLSLSDQYPDNCFPLIGLHPTSVTPDYKSQITLVEKWLSDRKFYGIGEIGIDLYWDKSYLKEQEEAFRYQVKIAKSANLPIVIHVRDSFQEVMKIIEEEQDGLLTGVFHCFSGDAEDAQKVFDLGFYIGIGGVVTFKNTNLREVLKETGLKHVVLETDAPYLAPVPYRGKRNESSYLSIIAARVAEATGTSEMEVARITTENAERLFGI
ncbi:MAG TPA: hydrolase TatD [Prolixibacteraceae bacterium]|nr:hydrolase TatD [Prolixibacteraceae bacterium]